MVSRRCSFGTAGVTQRELDRRVADQHDIAATSTARGVSIADPGVALAIGGTADAGANECIVDQPSRMEF